MPAIALAVLLATASMMTLAVALPVALYGGLTDPGLPVEWAQTLAVAAFAFALSGAAALQPLSSWSRTRPRPRPLLGLGLAVLLWALLAALIFTAVLTVLGAWEAAGRMDTPFWPVLLRSLTTFEWAALTGLLFVPLMLCCLVGGLGYAWSRAATERK